jgi:hypothetical protein
MEQLEFLVFSAPRGANAEVAQFRALVGCVPTLEHHVELRGLFSGYIALKPLRFHHAVAKRRRLLSVLAGEVVFSDGAARMFEDRQGLALGVERFSNLPTNRACTERRLYQVNFIFLSDGRQPYMFAGLLLQDVSDQIVLVQALHNNQALNNNDDATILLLRLLIICIATSSVIASNSHEMCLV